MDLIVQKATELGVRAIVPVYSEFSVVKLDPERSERRLEHWRKIARSACEQCGRHAPPHIEPPAPLTTAIEGLAPTATRLALDPEAEDSFGHDPSPRASLITAVGPEGGFAAADWRRLDAAGFVRMTLGRRVLRAETAAVTVCAIAQSLWGDL
jgi:16S rRNA (uracil1498-N3)-methyltransferase